MKKVQGTIKRSVEQRIHHSALYGVGFASGADSIIVGLQAFAGFFVMTLILDTLLDLAKKKLAK